MDKKTVEVTFEEKNGMSLKIRVREEDIKKIVKEYAVVTFGEENWHQIEQPNKSK